MEKIYLSIQSSITVIYSRSFFYWTRLYKFKKNINNKNYIVGGRNENIFSLTASLTASALGAWILFGPASAATWGWNRRSYRICIRYSNANVIFI